MTILKDQDVALRKFKQNDAIRMQELANNEKISINLRDAFPHPYTLSDAKDFIENCLSQDPITTFAIEYEGEYVGNIGLGQGSDVYRKSAEIGYFIGEPYWNKGITTKAVNLITKYGFEKLGIVRIHTGIYEYNPASMRVLEKCGFEKDGVFRAAIFKNGKMWDEHRFSIINPELIHNSK
jgi:RimJ/RimL family protein N-acetyltransferase